jgi:hypothetical protein
MSINLEAAKQIRVVKVEFEPVPTGFPQSPAPATLFLL